jgi:hypothetical protein
MKDQGSQKGTSKKPERTDGKSAAAEAPVVGNKVAPLTAKEKIAANQKNKRRK